MTGVDVTADNRHGCPSCGARTTPGAKFCMECGAPVAAHTQCSSCNSELAPPARSSAPSAGRKCPELEVPPPTNVSQTVRQADPEPAAFDGLSSR
ncbi:double zinc ribbon domain-containing protein [Flexivirga caeni]|uniref:double zinc ribbon domain-containing protein n=1 Tax=Flexivirga caeni TaxID=2294115 RepID=UPI003CCC79BF